MAKSSSTARRVAAGPACSCPGLSLIYGCACGERRYVQLHALSLASNGLKDLKASGLIEVLRMEDCALTSLDVSSNPLNGAMVLRALKFNTSLTYVNVRGTELDDDGVRDFGAMLLTEGFVCPIKTLSCDHFEVRAETKALSFANTQLGSPILTLLFGILKLNEAITSLDLTGVGVDAAAMLALETALSVNRTLTKLDLRDNPALWAPTGSSAAASPADAVPPQEAGSKALDALARGLHANSSMRQVHVDALSLPVPALKGQPQAAAAANSTAAPAPTELSYAASKDLSAVSAALLCALVEHNEVARRLDLSRNGAGAQLGPAVGRCLRGNTVLVDVRVAEAELKDEGVAALAEGLAANERSRLRFLDLSTNGIGQMGAASLAGLLGSSKALQKLDLGGNKLGNAGVTELMSGLSKNSTLAALSLRDTDMDAGGGEAVARVMRESKSLTTLWLGKNRLGNEGVTALVDALLDAKYRSKLATLDLHKNGLTKVGISSVTRLVEESPSLVALALGGSKIQFTETEVLQNAAKENATIGRTKPVRMWMGTDLKNWPEL